ncbi:putative RING finger protein P32A8-03c [Nymphaea thermarum]|nr:putative RING finger protein P32A8-03c [Nymphaea thermarum]
MAAFEKAMEASVSMVVEDEEARCPICLEGLGVDGEVRETPCRHRYHKDCIMKWLENHNTCLVCRCRFQMPVEENNPAAGGAVQRKDEGERRGRRAEAEEEQERQDAGYIGEDPLKHWSKKKVVCKISLMWPVIVDLHQNILFHWPLISSHLISLRVVFPTITVSRLPANLQNRHAHSSLTTHRLPHSISPQVLDRTSVTGRKRWRRRQENLEAGKIKKSVWRELLVSPREQCGGSYW